MADLLIPAGPGIPDGLLIPEADLVERFSRSPGPGGQSVNTTDSRVQLVFDVAASTLSARLKRRIITALGSPVTVTASEHRSQHLNRTAARERLADKLRAAVAPPPPPRRPTRPTRGSQQRRLAAKRRRGEIKGLRGRVAGDP